MHTARPQQIIDIIIVHKPSIIYAEETSFLAEMKSLAAKALVRWFRSPLPMPISKTKIQLSTDNIVNQTPRTIWLLKYWMNKGIEIRLHNIPNPFIT